MKDSILNVTGPMAVRFSAYCQFGEIHVSDSDHEEVYHSTVAFTAKLIKDTIGLLTDPCYLYCRSKHGGFTVYFKDSGSPTGVCSAGCFPAELEFLVYQFHKAGALSPTEDLRTARY